MRRTVRETAALWGKAWARTCAGAVGWGLGKVLDVGGSMHLSRLAQHLAPCCRNTASIPELLPTARTSMKRATPAPVSGL